MNNDLIRRVEAIEVIQSLQVTLGGREIFHPEAKKSVLNSLDELPSVDTEPVQHGYWEERHTNVGTPNTDYFCSQCNFASWHFKYNYCPNCGAKMDAQC